MLVVALELFVFLGFRFAAALPVLSAELADKNYVSISAALDDSAPADASSSHHGIQISASGHWERYRVNIPGLPDQVSTAPLRSVPSGVREAHDPLSTIFNHAQWENSEFDDTSPRSTSQIFAHAQWDEREIPRAPSHDHLKRTNKRAQARDEVQIFAYKQWERKDSVSGTQPSTPDAQPTPGPEASMRKEAISTGPVFFAHMQWEEE
ncbi:hypothetical protein DFH06DRAFT_1474277 [Mycena polygramma]|nr:hypothetical protein DFH06DRAFT_1474277 [Mycena polygramma]